MAVATAQRADWTNLKKLGAGANGTAYATSNGFYPNVVMKRIYEKFLWEEAEFLHQLDHPNIVHCFARVSCEEKKEGCRVGYLALERLGPSLSSVSSRPSGRWRSPHHLAYLGLSTVLFH